MDNEFNLQTYLINMEARLASHLMHIEGSIDKQNERIGSLETRITVVEKTTRTAISGLWALFVTGVGAVFTFLLSMLTK